MKADIVFQGGGVKAIGFVGAVCRLEEMGYKFERFAGSSAGAMVAAMLAAGYSGSELKDIIMKLNYSSLLDGNKHKLFSKSGKIFNLLINKGMYSGKAIESFVHEKLKKKNVVRFKDVSYNGKSKLKIIASDVTMKRLLILPDDIKYYGMDPMELEISKAVRMSISIPFYFAPVILKHGDCSSFIVDGGVISNYPIWVFDVSGGVSHTTFGLKFDDYSKKCSDNKNSNLFSYLIDLSECIIETYDEEYLVNKNMTKTLTIPTLGVKTTDFDISHKKCMQLFNAGYLVPNKLIL